MQVEVFLPVPGVPHHIHRAHSLYMVLCSGHHHGCSSREFLGLHGILTGCHRLFPAVCFRHTCVSYTKCSWCQLPDRRIHHPNMFLCVHWVSQHTHRLLQVVAGSVSSAHLRTIHQMFTVPVDVPLYSPSEGVPVPGVSRHTNGVSQVVPGSVFTAPLHMFMVPVAGPSYSPSNSAPVSSWGFMAHSRGFTSCSWQCVYGTPM
jgi:hypothetical protein